MMQERSFSLFDTAIGRCAIVWSERGVAGLQLPERSDVLTRSRAQKRYAATEAQPPLPVDVQGAVRAVQALLEGEPQDLRDVVLDLASVSNFNRSVYAITRRIGPGDTRSYGDIARELADAGAAPAQVPAHQLPRAVGRALGENPIAIIVPCHRVLAAGGRLGGFSAQGGVATKQRLLAIEAGMSRREGMLF